MPAPISPPPVTGSRDGDLPAYISNGLIGLRVGEQPLMACMALVNGVIGTHVEKRIEAVAGCPYPLAGDLCINEVWLSDQPWAVTDLKQAYNFECGELTTEFVFHVRNTRIQVKILTFASRTEPSLLLQEMVIIPQVNSVIGVRAIVETGSLRGQVLERRVDTPGEVQPVCDGSLLWEPEGKLSACGLAVKTELICKTNFKRSISRCDEGGPLVTEYTIQAKALKKIQLRQLVAMVPSIIHERPHEEAVRRVARGNKTGFETLRAYNRTDWEELWKGRIIVHGASKRHQELIDAAFFYLNSSVHSASLGATSIFGLATWHDYHYYFGHVMWDIDAFSVPALIFLQPKAALAILDFRMRGLPAAERNARLSSRSGLQFPWEASAYRGEEVSPGDGQGAAHEDHISLHVARAFSLYADCTGDLEFLSKKAWPVLSGVANWIVSRTTETKRGFEILNVEGVAEVPNPPDNDAFTSMAASEILHRAIRAAGQLGLQAPVEWGKVAAALYVPRRSDGVVASHDQYRTTEPKGATPSPLAGLFPYDYQLGEEEKQKTLEFYLSQWRDYVGSPMLPALYGTWAAMTGNRSLALQLFEEGYAAYDHARFHQCLEYRSDFPDSKVNAGPFFANLSGMLISLLLGYTGICLDEGDPINWGRRKIILPEGWKAIEVNRLWVRGKAYHLFAEQGGERAQIRPAFDEHASDRKAS